MWSWIGIVALYLASIGLFRLLGGLSSASAAIQRWGTASAERHRRRAAAKP
jgi:hypothetical protein